MTATLDSSDWKVVVDVFGIDKASSKATIYDDAKRDLMSLHDGLSKLLAAHKRYQCLRHRRSTLDLLSKAEERCLEIAVLLDTAFKQYPFGDYSQEWNKEKLESKVFEEFISPHREDLRSRDPIFGPAIRIWSYYRRRFDPGLEDGSLARLCRLEDSLRITALGEDRGEIREHCCVALLWLIHDMNTVRRCGGPRTAATPPLVSAVEVDFLGGVVKVVLGDMFSDDPKAWNANSTLGDPLTKILEQFKRAFAFLAQMAPRLAAAGIPLRAWVIEHNDRLLNRNLAPTHEPVFSCSSLERVAWSMWSLSTRVFGQGSFTYEDLADYLREPNTGWVKGAAWRVHIELRAGEMEKSPFLWLGEDNWRCIRDFGTINQAQPVAHESEQAFRKRVFKSINELKDPFSGETL